MAKLQTIRPAVVAYNTETNSLETSVQAILTLAYNATEIAWTSISVEFYDSTATDFNTAKYTLTNEQIEIKENGVIIVNITIDDTEVAGLKIGKKYLVLVKNGATSIKTNLQVIFIMAEPNVTIAFNRESKQITATYTPRTETETLNKYQITIIDANTIKSIETSGIITDDEIEYYYSSYLEPGGNYTISLDTYSLSGGFITNNMPITIPSTTNGVDVEPLIPVTPKLIKNEEYGFIKISMPERIIRYAEQVQSTGDNYIITVPNCYGCDTTADIYIYPSLSLTSKIKVQASSITIDTANAPRWTITIPKTAINNSINTCAIGFGISGSFKLVKEWAERPGEKITLAEITLPSNYVYEDYLIEQGSIYNYYLYSKDYSGEEDRVDPATIIPHWDSIVLSDATGRVLAIQYNPQISNFKSTILEQKQDTLGSKFPFFLRNGEVNYKEFSLSGLISYQADPLNKFQVDILDKVITARNEYQVRRRAGLKEYDEMYLERIYKIEVEKWLNNGQPKLLRTAAEGNFIVRLMNVSLSPMQQLGRRLHTFSATAYEIDDYNEHNLNKYGLNTINKGGSVYYRMRQNSINNAAVIDKQEKIIVNNLPYDEDGIGVNYFKIDLNHNPNLKLQSIIFKNFSDNIIDFVTNIDIPKGGILKVESQDQVSKNLKNSSVFWCYIFGNSNTGAEIELIYNTVGLEVEEE